MTAPHVTQHRRPASATRPAEENPDAATAERMSRVDTAWLRMDNDVNLMMIVGVWLLDAGDHARAALRERIARAAAASTTASARRSVAGRDRRALGRGRRLRHRPPRACAIGSAPARPERARARCRRCAASWPTTPLDPAHPLWQFHLIEHYEGGTRDRSRASTTASATASR
ncbi:MAG: hypothetical protein MZW92_63100 [Comamonadaceae bacterium]|nr:hypothetical protein [Comamonadaceae bacterium]